MGTPTRTPYVCKCGVGFTSERSLNFHRGSRACRLRDPSAARFSCPDCKFTAYYQKTLENHRLIRHSKEFPFVCKCESQFRSLDGLLIHQESSSCKFLHTCRICGHISPTQGQLNRHSRSHSDAKPFVCDCGRAYPRKDSFYRHQRNCKLRPQDDGSNVGIPQRTPLSPPGGNINLYMSSKTSPVEIGRPMMSYGYETSPRGSFSHRSSYDNGISADPSPAIKQDIQGYMPSLSAAANLYGDTTRHGGSGLGNGHSMNGNGTSFNGSASNTSTRTSSTPSSNGSMNGSTSNGVHGFNAPMMMSQYGPGMMSNSMAPYVMSSPYGYNQYNSGMDTSKGLLPPINQATGHISSQSNPILLSRPSYPMSIPMMTPHQNNMYMGQSMVVSGHSKYENGSELGNGSGMSSAEQLAK